MIQWLGRRPRDNLERTMASASADLPDDVATLQALLIAARAETAAHLLMIEKLKAQLQIPTRPAG